MALTSFSAAVAGTLGAEEPAVPELPRLPALSPAEALAAFQVSPGFRVSAAASEPQVVDPVSMTFDESGALYVAEMRDYSERRGERLSRVRRLMDGDGDGIFESSVMVMDGLAWVTSVCWHKEALYVAASPDIWRLRDGDGDGIPETPEKIFTGFGEGAARLNVQALVNSLTPGPDGWIYGATAANGGRIRRADEPMAAGVAVGGRDFSFHPDTLDFRTHPGGGQFGLTFDEWGRRFVCSNSHHIQWMAPVVRVVCLASPPERVDIAEEGPAAPVFRLSPDEPWRVLRTNWRASGLMPGIVEGEGKPSGYFTSASGIHLWRKDAIIADCGSNLVHRKTFRETVDGPVAVRPPEEKNREFLASTDTWFRPVAFTTAPDGSLLIADFYREYIEHPDSIPPNLKSRMDLDSGRDRGRIWRVTAMQAESAARPVPDKLLDEICAVPAGAVAGADWRRWWVEASKGSGRALATLFGSLTDEAAARRFFDVCSPDLPMDEKLELAARLQIPAPDSLGTAVEESLRKIGSSHPSRLNAMRIRSRSLERSGEGEGEGSAKEGIVSMAVSVSEPDAVRALALQLVPGAAPPLLGWWGDLSGRLRLDVLQVLSGSEAGTRAVLAEIGTGTVLPTEIPAAMAAAWRQSGDAEIRQSAIALLPPPALDRTAVIAGRQGVLNLEGDAGRGELLYQQRCAVCHQAAGGELPPGPDASSFRNKGKPLILLAILDPDREVAPQFARTTLTMKDGTVTAGVTVSENPEEIRLAVPGSGTRPVLRDQVARVERAAASLMPAGLEEGLSDQELADLLEWLVR